MSGNRSPSLRRNSGTVAALLGAAALAACSVGTDDATTEDVRQGPILRIGGIPDQDVTSLQRQFNLVADYLQHELDLEVRYAPANDYAAIVTAFQRGDVPLVWFGGLTGVQARDRVPGSVAIAQRPIDAGFYAVFITHADVNAETLSDLRGLSFTFGSESSTSGHLMPRAFLVDAGIDPDADFSSLPGYAGSHDRTYALVSSGAYQAGVLNEAVWDRAVAEGRVDRDNVRLLARVGPYYNYNWTVHPDIDARFGAGTRARIAEAFFSLGDSDHPAAAAIIAEFGGGAEGGFIPADNDMYDGLRRVAQDLGIIR